MRVIAGEAKGRKLAGIRSPAVRPTTDRVREALFSMIGSRIAGARILDLYAGSGALGIEALSRGATAAVFVESDPGAIAVINANLALTGLQGRATVLRMTAERYVARQPETPFDLVVADPPYSEGLPGEVLAALGGAGFLAENAEVVAEVSDRVGEPAGTAGLEPAGRRHYGDTDLLFWRPSQPAQSGPGMP